VIGGLPNSLRPLHLDLAVWFLYGARDNFLSVHLFDGRDNGSL